MTKLFTNIGVPKVFLEKMKSHFPTEDKPGFVWDSYLFAKASFEVFGEKKPESSDDVLKGFKSEFENLNVPVIKSEEGMSYTRVPLVLRTFSESGAVKDYQP